MRGSPTSRGTPASVRRSGSLPLRRRAAAPGKSTRPTPATCRPPALVCDCEYLITHDQRAWQEMTDGRGPPPKGKGHPRREDPGTRRPSAEGQLGPTGGNRIRASRGRPRDARPRLFENSAEEPAGPSRQPPNPDAGAERDVDALADRDRAVHRARRDRRHTRDLGNLMGDRRSLSSRNPPAREGARRPVVARRGRIGLTHCRA